MNPYLKIILRSILLWFLICLFGSIITLLFMEEGMDEPIQILNLLGMALTLSMLFSSPLFFVYNVMNFLVYRKMETPYQQFKKVSIITFLFLSLLSSGILCWIAFFDFALILFLFTVVAIIILSIEKEYFKSFEELKRSND